MKTDYDERVNDEADEHAQTVQEWRKDRERQHKLKLLECAITHFNNEIKDDNNEINNQ